jgi:predicted RNA-binding protein (virulence factor B family)
VERHLSKEPAPSREGDEVGLLIRQKSDLGYKAIIDNRYEGLLYHSEIFRPLSMGDRLRAYIKQVRPDGKIDLMLDKPGMEKVGDFAQVLLTYIDRQGGVVPLGDNSPAEEIYATFGVSKKTFKKAVGELYRKRLITLGDGKITRVEGE